MSILEINGVDLSFGGNRVLDGASFSLEAGTICGLVGPNGAGKTSLFNCMTGSYVPSAGTIFFNSPGRGRIDVLTLRPHQLTDLGIARTFQHPVLDMTVSAFENALCGGYSKIRGNPVSLAFRLPSVRRDERALRYRALETMEYLGLTEWSDTLAGSLPYAIQKKTELARAILSRPKMLLLDEPAGGLPRGEIEEFENLLISLRERFDLTILLVEHHMGLISRVTDKVVVMLEGRVMLEGTAAEVQRHPEVIEAYLGATA